MWFCFKSYVVIKYFQNSNIPIPFSTNQFQHKTTEITRYSIVYIFVLHCIVVYKCTNYTYLYVRRVEIISTVHTRKVN